MRFSWDARLAFGLLAISVLALAAFGVVGFGPLPSRALRSPAAEPPPPPPQAGTEFVDVTDAIGLAGFRHDLHEGARTIADAVAPGLGLLDLDDDDDLDLVLIGGPGARTGVSIFANRLSERHELGFDDVTEATGIEWTGAAQGVCAGDVDLDGDVDLFVTAIGGNLLLLNQVRNTGELAFVDGTEDAGLVGGRWHWVAGGDPLTPPATRPGPPPPELGPDHEVKEFSTGATFGDFDADGDLDLYVANYVCVFERRYQLLLGADRDRSERDEPPQFQPLTFEPQPDRFYLNELDDEGDLLFVDATRRTNARDGAGRGLGAVFLLVDSDIYPDLYLANDASDNVFLRNVPVEDVEEPGFRRCFEDATVRFGLDDPNSGMGIARGDADGDADLDLLTTNWRYQSASLFLYKRLASRAPDGSTRLEPEFEQNKTRSGLGDSTKPFVGWGCVFFDYDNDGDEDVFVGNGFTSPREGALSCTPERPLLFANDGAGHFTDVTSSAGAPLARAYSARGVVAGDLDRDGDLDLVLAQNNGPVVALENRLPRTGNESLSIAVTMGDWRRDAVNVQVMATVGQRQLVRELISGGSYLSQEPFEVHLGLGRSPRADLVRVTWPTAAAPPELLQQSPAGRRRVDRETP